MPRLVQYVQLPERAGGLGRDDAAAAEEEPDAGRGSQEEGGAELQGLVPEPELEIAAGEQGAVAPEGHAAADAANGSEAAVLPASSRALRQTATTKVLFGGLCFTPDGRSLVHGGNEDKELSLWDLRTAKRTVGLERTGGIFSSTISPDGSRLCVAAKDGLGMYRFPCSGEQLWDAEPGTAFCDAAFSRDGAMVASVRTKTGLVEIRDAETGATLHAIDDFPACHPFVGGFSHGLSFSGELLAIGGRHGKPSARQVRLVSLRGFATLKTLELSVANSLTFDPAGSRLAVTQGEPAGVLIFSAEDGWTTSLRLVPTIPSQVGTWSVAFSPDGKQLCAGHFPADTFDLWDVEGAVCLRTFKRPGTNGMACAFSPAGDVLATGGKSEPVVLHELWPQEEPRATFALPGDTQEAVSAGCASADVVVLAAGKRLVAVGRADSRVLWQTGLEAEAEADFFFPLALQPTGEQVACCMAEVKAVSVRDARTGAELRRLGPFEGWFGGSHYCPDGSCLMVFGVWGTKVYEAATGDLRHMLVDKPGAFVFNCAVDPSGRFLAVTGHVGTAFVKDMRSGDNLHPLDDSRPTLGVDFDDKGARMAYFLMGNGHEHNGQVIVCDATDGFRELRRTILPDLGWALRAQFSPGEGEFLLLASHVRGGTIVVLDSETLEEPAWAKCLRALALPKGGIPFHSVRWVTDPPAVPGQTKGDGAPAQPPLVLQAAVGHELHLIDVRAFIRSFEEDGNFSVAQLNRLSEINPAGIPGLLERWPHTVNLRDPTTGDTVLHHCARGGSSGDPKAALKAAMHWLPASGPPYELLKSCNEETFRRRSALHEAIAKQHMRSFIRQMLSTLNPNLPLRKTEDLRRDLTTCCRKLPGQLTEYIQLLQDPQHFGLFREIRKVNHQKVPLEDYDVRGCSATTAAKFDLDVLTDAEQWSKYEYSADEMDADDWNAIRIDTKHEVLALRGFATKDPSQQDESSYSQFFHAAMRLEAEVSQAAGHGLLNTKLMVVATQFKWQTFGRRRVLTTLVLYLMHLLLAAVTLFLSTQLVEHSRAFHEHGDGSSDWLEIDAPMWCDVLHVALLATNSLMLRKEWREVSATAGARSQDDTACTRLQDALGKYFAEVWNCVDLAGIVALYVASAAHFLDADFALVQVGGVGVLLNAWSVLQLLRPFSNTGPVIKVMTACTADVAGFMMVMAVMIWGYSVAFAVSMPASAPFVPIVHQNASVYGVAAILGRPLLTTTMAMASDFDVDQYHHVALAMFLSFLFFVIIVNFNVLIAIVSERFNVVMETADVEVRKLRAELMVNDEARMSAAEWGNTAWFPEYIEVLQVESSDPQTGLAQSEDTSAREERATEEGSKSAAEARAEEATAEAKAKVDAISEKQDAMAEKHGAMAEKQDALVAEVGKVVTDVAELKALLGQLVEQAKAK